ncbi:tape measure protein [Cryobacterium sp. Y62]|uniref:tape measure protein n=1 Tax=Cryobacterium sp. Y62 TaxID=2048284 RepID=UPI000CE355FE|nr:tape measure protein [Cryobacterium sp. Y62]
MATEIANAYITLTTKMPGVKKDIERAIGGEATGRKAGSSIMAGVKTAAKIGAVAVGASLAVAGAAGFRAAVGIETAQRTLTGLYGSAKGATDVMAGLRDVAKDSPIDYQAYLKAGESLAYAGVQGKDATGILKNVGLAITAAGGSSEALGGVTGGLTDIVNMGRVGMDSLNRISTAGVPIISGLAAHFGVSMDDINKMVSEGAVELDDVLSVMAEATGENFEKALGGGEKGAQSFGNQWKIAIDNITVAIGTKLLPLVSELAPMVSRAADVAIGAIEGISDAIKNTTKFFQDNISWLKPLAASVGVLVAAIVAWNVVSKTVSVVQAGVIAVMGTVKAVQLAYTAGTYGLTAASYAQAGSSLAVKVALLAGVAATGVATAAQWLFNAALNANPISLIILAIVALVAGLIWFFTQTELGQQIWANFTQFLTEAWTNIVNVATTVFTALGDFFTGLWQGISDFITGIWEGIVAFITLYINTVRTIITTVVNVIRAVWENIWNGISSFFTGIWEGILSAIRTVQAVFGTVFNAIGDIIRGAFDGVVSVVKGVINSIIDAVNGVIGGINGVAGAIGDAVGIDINIGKIPRLADGAIVSKRPGGIIANIGEGRYDEAVVPLGGPQLAKIRDAFGEDNPPADPGPMELSDITIEKLARTLSGYVRVQSRQGII